MERIPLLSGPLPEQRMRRKLRGPYARTLFILLLFLAPALLSRCGGEREEAPAAEEAGEGGGFLRDLPERPLKEPTGQLAVGTREYLWVDSTRKEPFTRDPDDFRHLDVQVWYPAASAGDGEPAPYLLHPDRLLHPEALEPLLHLKANSVLDAPLAEAPAPFPVLIYHHGGGWTRFSATFITEELASRGYVVFSVDHPGFDQTARFADGVSAVPDTLGFPGETGDLRRDALASWAYLEEEHFPLWLADGAFVLDRVQDLAAEPGGFFRGRLDLGRIGALGWSFGGATAVQQSADDPRIRAAVDHDGQLFGDVARRGTPRPVMLFHSEPPPTSAGPDAPAEEVERAAAMKDLVAIVRERERALREHSTGDWYDLELKGAQHGSFSDLVTFLPLPDSGLAASRGHEIIRAYTVAFFERYLRGEDPPLLRGDPPWPEVTLRRKGER